MSVIDLQRCRHRGSCGSREVDMPSSCWHVKSCSTASDADVQEDEMLLRLIKEYGISDWSEISSHMPSRSGKSCRLRWHNQLDPNVNRGPFQPHEDEQILKSAASAASPLQSHAIHGNRWSLIAKTLSNRTDNAVKNRFNSTLRKRAALGASHWLGNSDQNANSTISAAVNGAAEIVYNMAKAVVPGTSGQGLVDCYQLLDLAINKMMPYIGQDTLEGQPEALHFDEPAHPHREEQARSSAPVSRDPPEVSNFAMTPQQFVPPYLAASGQGHGQPAAPPSNLLALHSCKDAHNSPQDCRATNGVPLGLPQDNSQDFISRLGSPEHQYTRQFASCQAEGVKRRVDMTGGRGPSASKRQTTMHPSRGAYTESADQTRDSGKRKFLEGAIIAGSPILHNSHLGDDLGAEELPMAQLPPSPAYSLESFLMRKRPKSMTNEQPSPNKALLQGDR